MDGDEEEERELRVEDQRERSNGPAISHTETEKNGFQLRTIAWPVGFNQFIGFKNFFFPLKEKKIKILVLVVNNIIYMIVHVIT